VGQGTYSSHVCLSNWFQEGVHNEVLLFGRILLGVKENYTSHVEVQHHIFPDSTASSMHHKDPSTSISIKTFKKACISASPDQYPEKVQFLLS
jgi:hypothetical protein